MQKYKKQSSGFRNSVSNIKIGSLMKLIKRISANFLLMITLKLSKNEIKKSIFISRISQICGLLKIIF